MGEVTRLTSGKDFERVISKGKLAKNESFVLYYLPGETGKIRIGIGVGKSFGSAVKRNRVKRQIREALRKVEPNFDNIDAVLIARKAITGGSFDQICNGIDRVFSKVFL